MQLNQAKCRRMAGLTLIELMVAVVIGLIVLAGLTSIVVATLRTNTDNMRMTRLTQEMRGAMQLITRDLRRAGFSQNALESVGFGATSANTFIEVDYEDDPAVENPVGVTVGFDDDDCLTYAFDGRPILDPSTNEPTVQGVDGANDASEQYGVRYNENDLVVEYHQENGSSPVCGNDGGWEPMTDPELVQITALTFGDVDGDGQFPCVDIAGTRVIVREIQIVMTGRLTDDPDVQRTMQDTVRVRNDRVEDAAACP